MKSSSQLYFAATASSMLYPPAFRPLTNPAALTCHGHTQHAKSIRESGESGDTGQIGRWGKHVDTRRADGL